MVQQLKENAQTLISEYEELLTEKGIVLELSKKYFEVHVEDRTTYHPNILGRLLNYIEVYWNRKRERRYKYERNKYHCLVLSILPADKNLVRKDARKEYAFVLRKVERAHIGLKPESIAFKEEKILSKIERRIQKTLRKAERVSVEKVCSDSVFDAARYTFSPKYGYKKTVLGKDRGSWDQIFFMISVIVMVALVVCAYFIGDN